MRGHSPGMWPGRGQPTPSLHILRGRDRRSSGPMGPTEHTGDQGLQPKGEEQEEPAVLQEGQQPQEPTVTASGGCQTVR